METLAIVFAILSVTFVLDLARIDQIALKGWSAGGESAGGESRADISSVLAMVFTTLALVFGVLAAVV